MLIHIGYHKTATTWLQQAVFQEPMPMRMFMTLKETYDLVVDKSPFYFNKVEAIRIVNERMAPLVEQGVIPVLSHEDMSGNPLMGGGWNAKEIATRLHDCFPDATVLVVLRNQVDAICSLYKQYVLIGGCGSVNEFLEPISSENYQWFDYRHYCYDRLISWYYELFGENRVIVLLYEDLVRDRRMFVETLYGRMGVQAGLGLGLSSVVHKSLSDGGIAILRMLNRFARTPANQAPMISINGIRRVGLPVMYRSDAVVKKIFLSRNVIRRRVESYFANNIFYESNRKLEKLLGVNLKNHGYQ